MYENQNNYIQTLEFRSRIKIITILMCLNNDLGTITPITESIFFCLIIFFTHKSLK